MAHSLCVHNRGMTANTSRTDPAFLGRQKGRLNQLRQQILQVRRGQESDEADAKAQTAGQAHEYEDDAQKLDALELEGNLSAADDDRLSNIERALQKIEDGTYGLSDGSGAPIPMERLEAMPEALYTLDEQKARDAR
jgi:DnaK suppressor protein